ncbi:MAG: CBS domain-containing protein [Lysobacterales bacterium]
MVPVSQLLAAKGAELFRVAPQDPVIDAIRLMADKRVGALLVMQGEQLLGIVSERDYARKVILQGRSSRDTPVADIMTPMPLHTVTPSTRARECMRLMTEQRVRHLPVLDGERVVGVLSIGDLVRVIIEEQHTEIVQLKQYIAS